MPDHTIPAMATAGEQPAPSSVSSPDGAHTTQFVVQLVEAWNSHDLERVVPFYAPDYVGEDVAQSAQQEGREGIRQTLTRYWSAFPDLHFTLDELIVQDDRVALVWTSRGTHQGRLMNIPPTGRLLTMRGVSVLRLAGDRVHHALYIWDVAGLLRGIGLLPEL